MTTTPGRLAALIFLQMLPATLLAPAVRPLFAAHHGGVESSMHAFMSLNMLGAVLAAPFVARSRFDWLRALALLDALLLAVLWLPLPTPAALGLRFLEGGAHVGAATLLLARAASLARERGEGRIMGLAGGALMAAVACGSLAGGVLVQRWLPAPFLVGAAIELGVAIFAGVAGPAPTCARVSLRGLFGRCPLVRVPVSFAFAGRFTVGCLIVSFSLLAHRIHGLSDAAVGALFASFTLPFAALTYPAGRLADRVGSLAVLVPGALLWSAILPSLGFAPAWSLWILMPLGGVASAAIFAPTLRLASEAAGEARTQAMAAVNAAGAAGMLFGPPVAGLVSSLAGGGLPGWRSAFFAGTCALVLCVLATLRRAPVLVRSVAR